ncbi:MAG TPA: exodeoxyribonuclease VII small subunit [Jiangellaceae bacterium]
MVAKPDGADPDPKADGTDPAELTYEQARDELVGIVGRLEAGGVTLEESLALWQRGEDLAAMCERYLDAARERLDAARPSGTPTP